MVHFLPLGLSQVCGSVGCFSPISVSTVLPVVYNTQRVATRILYNAEPLIVGIQNGHSILQALCHVSDSPLGEPAAYISFKGF